VEAVPPDATVTVVKSRLVVRPTGEVDLAERLTEPANPFRLAAVTVYVPKVLVGA
jgi:hypothetical protein